MSRLRVSQLDPSGYLRTPWKNGGGVAIDIAGERLGDSVPITWDDMVWCFGRTAITSAGPFSDLSGFDRMQMVVAGRGLVLESPNGEIDERDPGFVVRFDGHLPVVTRLESGPVEVVNLIGLQQRVSIDLRTLSAQDTAVLAVGVHVVYAAFEPCELRCDGIQYALPHDHALQIECEADVVVVNEAGQAVVGSVFSRGRQLRTPTTNRLDPPAAANLDG